MAKALNRVNQNFITPEAREIASLEFNKHQYQVDLVHRWSHDRKEIERFTHDIYALRHKANITHFLPNMVVLRDKTSKQIIATAGFQSALEGRRHKALFLERYLDFPIEKAASAIGGRSFKRSDFVEVGNLAGALPGAGYLVILALAEYLTKQGHAWIAFTLTKNMVRAFESLNLKPIPLVGAAETRVEDGHSTWGNYFKSNPEVMIGDMQSAYKKMQSMGLYRSVSYHSYSLDQELRA